MDWFAWLSKTGLEPSLIYEYGRIFTRNELRGEDSTHFNHEFLQSMGISVAKHRLEILKLARKEVRGDPNSLSRLVLAVNKTKRLLTKKIGNWVFHKGPACTTMPDMSPYRSQWVGTALRKNACLRSGPLERKGQERFVTLSGPLERKVQERLMGRPTIAGPVLDGPMKRNLEFDSRSPNISGPLDRLGLSPRVRTTCTQVKMASDDRVHSLWPLMFQDMKPT